MTSSFSRLGLWIRETWARRTGLLTFTIYMAFVEAVLILWRLIAPASAAVWAELFGIFFVLCLAVLGLRWARRVLMWRLRNRLVITYIFIGVIPLVLLAAIGFIATYLFVGQFASFVVTSGISADLKTLQELDRSVAQSVAAQLAAGTDIQKVLPTVQTGDRDYTVTLWLQQRGQTRVFPAPAGSPVIPPPSSELHRQASSVIIRDGRLYLQAWTTVPAGDAQLTVITAQPLGVEQLQHIAFGLGEIELSIEVRPERSPRLAALGGGISNAPSARRTPSAGSQENKVPRMTAGRLPAPVGRWDVELVCGGYFEVVDWTDGAPSSALMRIRTRPSLLYHRLFSALGEFSDTILIALAGIAMLFGLIELAALFIGIRLTRTMTQSVAELYDATQHINQGNLSHRIKVKRQDQMAALETSFNSMTESLEKLIAEQKEKQRMESELAIAQEVQAQLFPRQSARLDTLEVHGVCRPARTVSGDYFDFLPLGPERLGVAVGDISGKGISAALLMATIHSAVRVYEFGRVPESVRLLAASAAAAEGCACSAVAPNALMPPSSVLSLLNHHLFNSTPPEKYATLFLTLWDGEKRRLSYSNGGHLAPLVFHANGSMTRLQTGGTVIGLFDDMQWEEASLELQPGDLFVAYSDGVTEPENEFGEFGEQRLIEIVKEHWSAPLARISDEILTAVKDWIGSGEQPDDLTVVLARAR
jgi:sigma-B regulation protein RsbU (phosphoserine phosphatase)